MWTLLGRWAHQISFALAVLYLRRDFFRSHHSSKTRYGGAYLLGRLLLRAAFVKRLERHYLIKALDEGLKDVECDSCSDIQIASVKQRLAPPESEMFIYGYRFRGLPPGTAFPFLAFQRRILSGHPRYSSKLFCQKACADLGGGGGKEEASLTLLDFLVNLFC